MNITDGELLQRYTRDRSEAAFTQLVQRHLNLIYSAALRQVNGNTQLAEDVTQAVFTDLARKAPRLTRHPSLTGWLYTSVRYVAANTRRTEQRRSARELEAHAMNALLDSSAPEPDWATIHPLLDDAMHTLDESDREAVLLRHFEHRSFAEIGEHLGVAENTARMRVQRALEKLHAALRKRGVTSTALVLAGLLTANGVGAAPAQLAARIAATALAGAATTGGLSALLAHFFTATNVKIAAGVLLLAAFITLVALTNKPTRTLSPSTNAAPTSLAANSSNATTNTESISTNTSSTNQAASAKDKVTNGLVLHLQIVTADSGQPIPHVPVEMTSRTGDHYKHKDLVSTRAGMLDVVYPTNVSQLELTTREDDFADTHLIWNPSHGDVIPTNYVLRLDRPVPIGGLVVDAAGNPVAGAKVGWNHTDSPGDLKLPQNHEFFWIETTTDKSGRWRLNRIADDMIPRLYGYAGDSNYLDAPLIFVSQDKAMEKDLRAQTHVFHLGTGLTVKGIVVDESGSPIADAQVLVGERDNTGSRSSKSGRDGAFSIAGCSPEQPLITAEATGYAVTTIKADLSADAAPVRLVMHPGKTLRLRVVNDAGQPIPKAQIYTESHRLAASFDPNTGSLIPPTAVDPQVDYSPKTDADGRAVWTNAPDGEMIFDAVATGFMRSQSVKARADGEEHLITMTPSLILHGNVTDAATGQPIVHFRLAVGWSETNYLRHTVEPHWSTIGRFWVDFVNGVYRHDLEEPPIVGTVNLGYFVKFMAEGHSTFVSRHISPDEHDVQLDVALQPVTEAFVLVNKPDGQPAANADVGFISPGSQLYLKPGGFNWQNVQSGGYLIRSGSDGSFKLPLEESLLRVIVASPDGYAEATPSALATNPVMQLQPWGSLEVNGQASTSRQYQLEFGGGSPTTVSFDFVLQNFNLGPQGHFSVRQLPPGHHSLILVRNGFPGGTKTPFEIRPGETTTLNLATNLNQVIAHVEWPAGLTRPADCQGYSSFVPLNAPKSSSLADSLTPDGNVSAQDIPSGTYNLSVIFFTETKLSPDTSSVATFQQKPIATGSLTVTIPADLPPGPFNAGTILLQPASSLP